MVKKLFDSILGKSPARNEEDYMELDLASYEGSNEEVPASMYIKIATIADLKDTPPASKTKFTTAISSSSTSGG